MNIFKRLWFSCIVVNALDYLSNVAFVIFDENLKYHWVYGGSVTERGLKSLEGKTLFDLNKQIPGSYEALYPFYKRVLEGESFEVEKYNTPDQKDAYHCYFTPAIKNWRGKVVYACIVVQKINDKLALERELSKAREGKKIKRLAREVSRVSFSQLMKIQNTLDSESKKKKPDCSLMQAHISKAFKAVSDLSALTGDFLIREEDMDLAILLYGVCSDFEGAIYLGPESYVIKGDYGYLKKAFEKLVENALEHDDRCEVSLDLLSKKITVKNKGLFLDIESCSEPFCSTKTDSMGLGIPIAEVIFKKHKARFFYDVSEGYTSAVVSLL